jgi:hypothetical protein
MQNASRCFHCTEGLIAVICTLIVHFNSPVILYHRKESVTQHAVTVDWRNDAWNVCDVKYEINFRKLNPVSLNRNWNSKHTHNECFDLDFNNYDIISYRFLSDAIIAEALDTNWKLNVVSKRITNFGLFVYSLCDTNYRKAFCSSILCWHFFLSCNVLYFIIM